MIFSNYAWYRLYVKQLFFGVFLIWGNLMAAAVGYVPGTMLVAKVPVASVWTDDRSFELVSPLPGILTSTVVCGRGGETMGTHDTQLLLGEPVRVLKHAGASRLHVQLPKQPHYNHTTKVWGLCDGYVDRTALTLPADVPMTRLVVPEVLVSEKELRDTIVATVRLFIGAPYVWGGASPYEVGAAVITGFDCSGLVMYAYNKCGLLVPRNANPQFEKTVRIEPKDVQPGDLLFLKFKNKDFAFVAHVMCFVGDDCYVEAAGDEDTPKCVREISATERLGKPLAEMANGEHVLVGTENECEVWCGSFLRDSAMREAMFNDYRALRTLIAK